MEYAKALRYVNNKYYYVLYLCLIPMWGIPRCFIFPLTSIKACFIAFKQNIPMRILELFVIVLWVLDCVWWYMILQMLGRALTGTLNKDVRSEDEEDISPDLVAEMQEKQMEEERKKKELAKDKAQ